MRKSPSVSRRRALLPTTVRLQSLKIVGTDETNAARKRGKGAEEGAERTSKVEESANETGE